MQFKWEFIWSKVNLFCAIAKWLPKEEHAAGGSTMPFGNRSKTQLRMDTVNWANGHRATCEDNGDAVHGNEASGMLIYKNLSGYSLVRSGYLSLKNERF